MNYLILLNIDESFACIIYSADILLPEDSSITIILEFIMEDGKVSQSGQPTNQACCGLDKKALKYLSLFFGFLLFVIFLLYIAFIPDEFTKWMITNQWQKQEGRKHTLLLTMFQCYENSPDYPLFDIYIFSMVSMCISYLILMLK